MSAHHVPRLPAALTSARTTLALKGTTCSTKANLSFPSALAIEFAQAWLEAAGSLKVPSSGIVRRAVLLYAKYLESADLDSAEECRAVARCCSVLRVGDDDQAAAMGRLEALDRTLPFPPFANVMHGRDEAAANAAFTSRAEELAQQVLAERTARARAARSQRHQ